MERSEYLSESEVPQRLLAVAGGKEIFSEEQAYVSLVLFRKRLLPGPSHQQVPNERDKRPEQAVLCPAPPEMYGGQPGDQGRQQRVCPPQPPFQQRHALTAIPICKVHFSVGNSKGIFYVYGNSRQCYVPTFPAKCTIL